MAMVAESESLSSIQYMQTPIVNKLSHQHDNGGLPQQQQTMGRKEQLKLFIKATLCNTLGRVVGLFYREEQNTKLVVPLEEPIKSYNQDGRSTRPMLQEQEANKMFTDLELSECDEHGKVLLPGMVEAVHADIVKYWLRRYSLFSRFDNGIKLDEEALFSVTPEEIAKNQAAHCGSGTVIDAFAGVGGNSIQFACKNLHVIAIDIDPKKIEYAQHNAEIYGVASRIDFVVGDFLQLAPTLKADVVFLSPPWGGPEYIKADKYDIETMLKPVNGISLFKLALAVAPSIAFFLPRTVDANQLEQLSWLSKPPLPYQGRLTHTMVDAVGGDGLHLGTTYAGSTSSAESHNIEHYLKNISERGTQGSTSKKLYVSRLFEE